MGYLQCPAVGELKILSPTTMKSTDDLIEVCFSMGCCNGGHGSQWVSAKVALDTCWLNGHLLRSFSIR